MNNNNPMMILFAAATAIVAPIFLANFIYPAFKVFLPDGNIVLTPPLRITATIVMAVIDYLLAYIFINRSSKRDSMWFNLICFILTFMWNVFIGVLWYIVI